jgi:hypothetical protein
VYEVSVPATNLQDIDRDAAVQSFRSAKSYMRIALECLAEGDVEGAFFWRDNMAYPALDRAIAFREAPEAKATRRRRILAGEAELVSYPEEAAAVLKAAREAGELEAATEAAAAETLQRIMHGAGGSLEIAAQVTHVTAPVNLPARPSLLSVFAKNAPKAVEPEPEKLSQPTRRRLISML